MAEQLWRKEEALDEIKMNVRRTKVPYAASADGARSKKKNVCEDSRAGLKE
jgi:hypothetical protein